MVRKNHLILFYICILLTCLLQACSARYIAKSATIEDWKELSQDQLKRKYSKCYNTNNYITDTSNILFWPMQTIRVNVHIMDKKSMALNMDSTQAFEEIKRMIREVNAMIANQTESMLPKDSPVPPSIPRFRVALESNPKDNSPGIYFHYDEEIPRHVHRGKNSNIGNSECYNKYKFQQDSVLNIFFLAHHPDSLASKTYNNNTGGVAIGNRFIKVISDWKNNYKPYQITQSIVHEIGHIYSLSHSWIRNDGCDDTPPHRNCWNYNEPEGCNEISNNIMAYTAYAKNFTPCQTGRMQMAMSRPKSKARRFIKNTWCEGIEDQENYFDKEFTLSKHTALSGNLHLLPGAKLEITCSLSMPKDSYIYVYPDAELSIIGGKIYNECGLPWNGIVLLTKGKKQGKIKKNSKSSILNVGDKKTSTSLMK